MQQLPSRVFEAEVVQHLQRRLAQEGAKLTLQRAAGKAGSGRELGNADISQRRRLHEIEGAPHAARQHAGCFGFLGRHDFLGSCWCGPP